MIRMKMFMRALGVLFLMPMLLMGGACDGKSIVYETRYVTPQVSEDLRTPCPITHRIVREAKDIGMVLADEQERADCNGIKIVKTDEILDRYEKTVEAAITDSG